MAGIEGVNTEEKEVEREGSGSKGEGGHE